MIAEMAASGLVSFQCHTVNHVDLRYQDEAGLRAEFGECARIIEEITGRPVKALAYPAGGYNSTVIDIASEYFDFAYTTKSPYYVKEYSTYEVPRYYVARGEGRNQFYNKLR
jgi:peptidoglycan/xylan/chitin deacetylase (PgdA/CDA1 family)